MRHLKKSLCSILALLMLIGCIPFIGITDRAFPRKDSQKTLNILSVFNTIESERWGTTHEE